MKSIITVLHYTGWVLLPVSLILCIWAGKYASWSNIIVGLEKATPEERTAARKKIKKWSGGVGYSEQAHTGSFYLIILSLVGIVIGFIMVTS